MKTKHIYFMQEALKEASKAYKKKEVPVGCVIVCDNKIVARAHNLRKTKESTLAHAELLAIKKANKKLKSWRLEDCSVYVTLEPCVMCAGALMQARVKDIYYATNDPKGGALGGAFNLYDNTFNHTINLDCGILKEEAKNMLQNFFKELRK